MEQKKSFFADKGIGWYLALPVAAVAIAAVLLYRKTGVTQFSPELSNVVIIAGLVAAGLSLISIGCNAKMIKYAAYIAALYAFIRYIATQITYIANVVVSIDGTTFSKGMIITSICFLAAWILALIAAILAHAGKGKGGQA